MFRLSECPRPVVDETIVGRTVARYYQYREAYKVNMALKPDD